MGRATFILLALAAGCLMALQARINSFVATDLGDSITAGAVVFAAGFVTMAAVAVLSRGARRSVQVMWGQLRRRELPRYLLLAGPAGMLGVLAQTMTVQVIGVALFSLSFILGQMVASTSIDHFGWSLGMRRRLNIVGGAALALAMAGVATASVPRLDAAGASVWAAFAFVFAAGMTVSTHMAFNGRITAAVGRPEPAALATYIFGTAAVALAIAALAAGGLGRLDTLVNVKVWYLALGLVGPVVVLLAAAVVRRVGVLLFALGMVTGQLIGSILLDLYWPATNAAVSWPTLAGAALSLCALIVLQRWGQRNDLPVDGGGGRSGNGQPPSPDLEPAPQHPS
ncbi:DMT family transporter [Arthrobacter crystallopoietes]|uniref:DMT family transporter n=1 Tax=Crystallibacter crystallopoietes TaxID=37928 RepID=UPI003D206C72